MELIYFNSLSPVALFLHDCCAAIVSSVEGTYLPENKRLFQLILAYQAAPQDERQIKALLTSLKQKFNRDWLDKAKDIQKLKHDNALRIAYGSNSILIRLHNSNTKAVLTVSEKRKRHEFIVEAFPDDDLVRTMTREESLDFVVSAVIETLLPTFIFRLASDVPNSTEDFRILSNDKNFMKLLESTRNNFDRRTELFMKVQTTHSTV